MRKGIMTTAMALLLFALTGCSTVSIKDENALLRQENEALRGQLEDRNVALESASQELRDRDLEVSDLRRELTDARTMEPISMAMPAQTGFEGIDGVSGSYGGGGVTASLESDILFDSGKTNLKSTKALDSVLQVLKATYPGKRIQVAGHTDSDPIRKSGFKSNYHLGFDRAFAVREYLVKKGIESDRIAIASHGPNQTLESKAASRRVEIVVLLDE